MNNIVRGFESWIMWYSGIILHSNIDKQNFSLSILFYFLKKGLIAFERHLITPNFWAFDSDDLFIFKAASKSRKVDLFKNGTWRNWAGSIWILFRPQFFVRCVAYLFCSLPNTLDDIFRDWVERSNHIYSASFHMPILIVVL
jgi:hypothetical protein